MSENIQSISQGTYTIGESSTNDSSLLVTQNEGDVSILQTQQEVSHDNTLSGNGTVDSPLGVVPGYNETVLYDNTNPTAVTSNTSVNLSESYLNFKELKLYIKASFGSTGNMNYVVTTFVSQDNITEIGSIAMPNTQSTVLCDSNCYVFYSTEPLVCYIKSNGERVNIGVGSTNVTNDRGTRLYKVIGVNRIANN